MSEYIYGHEPSGCDAFGNPVSLPTLVKREEIVRCMDCRHFSYGSDNGTGSDWCDFHEHIAWSHLGFCSWAERREQCKPLIVKNADSYKLGTREQDTRERLEADISAAYYMLSDRELDPVFRWLDRQAAITEREVKERVDFSLIAQTADALFPDYQEQIDELTAEVEAQRKRANDAERGVLSEEWYVCRDRYEDDIAELTAERDELRETINGIEHGQEMLDLRSHIHERDKQIAELTAERDGLQAAIDAMGNGQFYAMYIKACEERDHLKDLVQESAERICVPHGEWERLSQTQEFRRMYCDCGYELGMDTHETFPYEHTVYFPMPYFCPECGARIVSKAKVVEE